MRKLKVGDRIRITGVASDLGNPDYYCPRATKIVWRKLAARKRSVRICEIDSWGVPWYHCKFWNTRYKRWEHHYLSVGCDEDNWKLVKSSLWRNRQTRTA